MHRAALALLIFAVLSASACGPASARPRKASSVPPPATLFAAPTGTPDAAGTAQDPLSLVAAIRRGLPGEVIQLAPGDYPKLVDMLVRPGPVTLTGPARKDRRGRPRNSVRIAGAGLFGASNLRFKNITFTDTVLVSSHVKDKSRGAADLAFDAVEFTADYENCLIIRSGARRIRVVRSWVHDCARGISGPPSERSAQISIKANRMERFSIDGIAFGSWDDVVIDRNDMRTFVSPKSDHHNDGIQFFGNSRRVRITRNRIINSDGQIILVQPYFGPIEDVLIENNALIGSGAYAVQVQGVPRTRIINNTIWRSRYSALLLRGYRGPVPTDTVVVNNVLQGLKYDHGAKARRRANWLTKADGRPGPGDRFGADPGFVNAAKGNFRIRKRSPLKHAASPFWAPKTDVDGRQRGRRSAVGAFR